MSCKTSLMNCDRSVKEYYIATEIGLVKNIYNMENLNATLGFKRAQFTRL